MRVVALWKLTQTFNVMDNGYTYGDLNRILVTDKADFRSPGIPCDDCSDKDESLVVRGVRGCYVCAIG